MKQKRDEPFRSFSSRVRGKAETCGFSTTSVCDVSSQTSNSVDYTDHIIRDVLVAGIYNADIRRDVLGVDMITDKSVNEVIGLVEKREMARDVHNVSANMSSFSTYRKEVRKVPVPRKSPGPLPGFSDTCTASRTSECVPCPQCGNQFTHFREGRNGVVNSKPFEVCIDCFRSKRQRGRQRQNGHALAKVSGIDQQDQGELDAISQISTISSQDQINIVGALPVRLQCVTPDGIKRSCATMVYISPCAEGFFLSLEAMFDLDLLKPGSPFYPSELRSMESKHSPKTCDMGGIPVVAGNETPGKDKCACPARGEVPSRPKSLPFEPVPDNNSKMKTWLLERFSSSTFNVCPHQTLPSMAGPKVQIHMSKNATPKAFHTPAPVPLHWKDQVYADLLRDEALGVIE